MACSSQALLNQRSGSSNSLSSMQSAQSHQNLAGMHVRGLGAAASGGMQRSASNKGVDSSCDLLSAGSQHLSASQLLALVRLLSSPLQVSILLKESGCNGLTMVCK
jgi:hypothetical protein